MADETLSNLLHEDRRFEPTISEDGRATRLDGWHRAVERSRAWHRP